MSFEDIGKQLGITAGGAWALYARAIQKLRRRSGEPDMQRLRELIAAKESMNSAGPSLICDATSQRRTG